MTLRTKFWLLAAGMWISLLSGVVFAFLMNPWFGAFACAAALGAGCSSELSSLARDVVGNETVVPGAAKKVRKWQK